MEVIIRAFELADWEDVAEMWSTPHCQQGTLQLPYQSRDDIKKKLTDPPPGLYRLVAVVKESQKVVGMIGLHTERGRRAHAAHLGM